MRYFILSIAVLLLISCGNVSDSNGKTVTDTMQLLKPAVAQSFGLPADSVEISDTTFIIAGDGEMGLADAVERFGYILKDERASEAAGATQRISPYVVNVKKYQVVKVYAEPTVPVEWIAAIDSAISYLNNVNAGIRFKRQEKAANSTTKIITTSSNSSTVATAAYPFYYGGPGNRITINLRQSRIDQPSKVHAVVHELMHTIGFGHTDGTYGSVVTGTPISDHASVMNHRVTQWKGFSQYDLHAIRKVYP